MGDLISRQAAIDALVAETIYTEEELKEYYEANSHRNEWVNGIHEAVEVIKQLPPAHGTNLAEVGADCISRQAVKEILDKNQMPYHVYPYVWDAINALPPAQPERIKGHWTRDNACSECGCQPWFSGDIHNYNFCPNCGADMREVTP